MSTSVVRHEGTQEVAIPQYDELTQIQRMGKMFAASGYFQDTRDLAQACVKIIAGKELGVPPVASMMQIHIIKGKVTLGATLIASRIRAHGYDFRVKRLDNTGCVIEFLGKLEGGKRTLLGESSFTEADYKAAKINSDMYQKFPRNMYYSRAISNGARWHTPEIFGGSPVYTPDELGASVDSEGEYVAATTAGPAEEQSSHDAVIESEPAPAEPVPIQPRADPNVELVALENRFMLGSKFERLAIFQDLKKRLQTVLGKDHGEMKYYEWLGVHGVQKSDEFKSVRPAWAAAKDLLVACQQAEAGTRAFLGVSEDDLPMLQTAEVSDAQ